MPRSRGRISTQPATPGPGVRPSSAAASQAVSSARKSPKRHCRAAVAAPGDGRTPRWLTQPPSKARTGSAAVLGRSDPGSLEREEIARMLLQGRSCCARGRAQPSMVVLRCAPCRRCLSIEVAVAMAMAVIVYEAHDTLALFDDRMEHPIPGARVLGLRPAFCRPGAVSHLVVQ